jgi:hypothetical protein
VICHCPSFTTKIGGILPDSLNLATTWMWPINTLQPLYCWAKKINVQTNTGQEFWSASTSVCLCWESNPCHPQRRYVITVTELGHFSRHNEVTCEKPYIYFFLCILCSVSKFPQWHLKATLTGMVERHRIKILHQTQFPSIHESSSRCAYLHYKGHSPYIQSLRLLMEASLI